MPHQHLYAEPQVEEQFPTPKLRLSLDEGPLHSPEQVVAPAPPQCSIYVAHIPCTLGPVDLLLSHIRAKAWNTFLPLFPGLPLLS